MKNDKLLTKEEIEVLENLSDDMSEKEQKALERMAHKIQGLTKKQFNDLLKRSIEVADGVKNKIEISPPYTLEKFLSTLKKEELTEIRRSLDIKGLSKYNKEDLIEALVVKIPYSIEELISYFDKNQYELLIKMSKKEVLVSEIEGDYTFFQRLGMAFVYLKPDGEPVMVMPEEIATRFREISRKETIKNMIKRNTRWVEVVHGIMFNYGALKSEDFFRLVQEYGEIDDKDFKELIRIILIAEEFYGQFESNVMSELIFYHMLVYKPEHTLKLQQSNNFDFYPYTSKEITNTELLNSAQSQTVKSLIDFFVKNYEDLYEVQAKYIVEEIIINIKNSQDAAKIVNNLQFELEIPNSEIFKKLTRLVVQLEYDTRQWGLKGYKPSEINEKEESQQKTEIKPGLRLVVDNTKDDPKVSRNKPCPCGSNKKYKNCCGK
ncbi:SEC-C metal-binding domain-containing protein [Proteinivorax tanatarense]|uniref:SEC-C metal-binding domain-containing protein n=1 Tax=Proteinivorax tanatarense TaxID=1260629 RepID=A0AAU7VMK8_9FIRM